MQINDTFETGTLKHEIMIVSEKLHGIPSATGISSRRQETRLRSMQRFRRLGL